MRRVCGPPGRVGSLSPGGTVGDTLQGALHLDGRVVGNHLDLDVNALGDERTQRLLPPPA